jgi:membrane protein YdbS with pleckstrin-like domain
MFWPSVVLILAAGGVGYFAGRFTELWQNALLYSTAAAALLLLFILPLGFWLSKRYTITTRRLIIRHGFFVRVRQELLHSRGYDVTLSRSWLQSAFRSGDVRINAGLERPVELRDVPRADLVQDALHDLMEHSQNVISAHRQHDESAATDETTVWGTR